MSVLAPETIDLTALPFIPLEQRALLPNIPAIYFVLGTDNHVLYIGRAAFLRQRWHKHHRLEEFLLMAHITIASFAVANRQSLPTLEHLCITQFNPSCNAILPLMPRAPLRRYPAEPKAATLGGRICQCRESLGLSQVELAREAGITQGLLSRIENGHTPNPGANVLKGLALALHCSTDYLIGLYDEYMHGTSPRSAGAITF